MSVVFCSFVLLKYIEYMKTTHNVLSIRNFRIERDYSPGLFPMKIRGKIDAKIECTCPITHNTFLTIDLHYESRGFYTEDSIIEDLAQRIKNGYCSYVNTSISDCDILSTCDRKINHVNIQLDDFRREQFAPIFVGAYWFFHGSVPMPVAPPQPA